MAQTADLTDNAWEATKALKTFLGPHYISSTENMFTSFWKSNRECIVRLSGDRQRRHGEADNLVCGGRRRYRLLQELRRGGQVRAGRGGRELGEAGVGVGLRYRDDRAQRAPLLVLLVTDPRVEGHANHLDIELTDIIYHTFAHDGLD